MQCGHFVELLLILGITHGFSWFPNDVVISCRNNSNVAPSFQIVIPSIFFFFFLVIYCQKFTQTSKWVRADILKLFLIFMWMPLIFTIKKERCMPNKYFKLMYDYMLIIRWRKSVSNFANVFSRMSFKCHFGIYFKLFFPKNFLY